MVHTVFCTCFMNNDTIVDTRVEHLEDFDNTFAYHTLSDDMAIILCPLGLRSMDGPHLQTQHMQHPSSMQIKTFGSSLASILIIVDTTIPSCFMLLIKPNALHWMMYQ